MKRMSSVTIAGMSHLSFQLDSSDVGKTLIEHAEKVEYGLPMLMFKTEDEAEQLKRFIVTYYRPFFTPMEIDTLS